MNLRYDRFQGMGLFVSNKNAKLPIPMFNVSYSSDGGQMDGNNGCFDYCSFLRELDNDKEFELLEIQQRKRPFLTIWQ